MDTSPLMENFDEEPQREHFDKFSASCRRLANQCQLILCHRDKDKRYTSSLQAICIWYLPTQGSELDCSHAVFASLRFHFAQDSFVRFLAEFRPFLASKYSQNESVVHGSANFFGLDHEPVASTFPFSNLPALAQSTVVMS